MKFIDYGVQDGTWAKKTYDPATDSRTVKLVPVKERYVRIYLPWRRIRYVINADRELPTQPCWGIYWHQHPNFQGCYFARWSWQ